MKICNCIEAVSAGLERNFGKGVRVATSEHPTTKGIRLPLIELTAADSPGGPLPGVTALFCPWCGLRYPNPGVKR